MDLTQLRSVVEAMKKAGVGERTGLNVIAVQSADSEVTAARPDLPLSEGSVLVMIGTAEQLGTFRSCYGRRDESRSGRTTIIDKPLIQKRSRPVDSNPSAR